MTNTRLISTILYFGFYTQKTQKNLYCMRSQVYDIHHTLYPTENIRHFDSIVESCKTLLDRSS